MTQEKANKPKIFVQNVASNESGDFVEQKCKCFHEITKVDVKQYMKNTKTFKSHYSVKMIAHNASGFDT